MCVNKRIKVFFLFFAIDEYNSGANWQPGKWRLVAFSVHSSRLIIRNVELYNAVSILKYIRT